MSEKRDRYQILNELGRGGFATVYRARDTELGRLVALKELHPHLLADSGWVERFRQEARLIAGLNHPHIVTLHDIIGQAHDPLFLVMQLVEGPGLDRLLAERGQLPWAEALEIIRAVAEGLDYAHRQNILHRDLKPANILMDPARGPLLNDFGLAKLMEEHSLSQSGSIVGTPHYIPPEIWDGERATPQADIYALGCILYELLTGQRPFGGNTPPAIMMAHFRPLILPQSWGEGVPPGVAEVLNIALAKHPGERYATAGKMVEALLTLSGLAVSSTPLFLRPSTSSPPSPSAHIDWGEAPDVAAFYGREAEAEQLTRWLIDDRCRLVAVLGMGGLGKTTLVTRLADHLQHQFAYVAWRSLRNAPPLEEILEEWLLFLADQQIQALPAETDKRLSRLLDYLRQKRCLLILDNVETIMHEEKTGHYRPGYEGYSQLLQRVGETRHQSCLILTSREKPAEFVRLEGETTPVHSLLLPHLTVEAGRELLQGKGLNGPAEAWQSLIERYSGNPLALKVVAETIRELFKGEIAAFLAGDIAIFGGIRELLAEQFDRLSALEQELMTWLAIEREAIEPEQLQANLVQSPPQRDLLERLRSLRRRSLLERGEAGFILQNVVMEYVTDRLVEEVSQELIDGEVAGSLNRYALLKAQAKEYVRASQLRLILQPIIERLQVHYRTEGGEARLKELVVKLRQVQSKQTEGLEPSAISYPEPGYAAGNLLNLLLSLKPEVKGVDFSGLSIWQAYLQGMRLREVNFSRSDLAGTVFTEIFKAVMCLAFSPDGQLLAAGSGDGQVWIRRTSDGQLLLTCDGKNWTTSVCFSPDGQIIASTNYRTIHLWDVRSGQNLKSLEGHTDQVRAACFSPDGQSIASASCDRTLRLWEVHSGHCLKTLEGHTDEVRAVRFSPDGQTLASGSNDQTIRLWELRTGQCLSILQGHTNVVESISFSPDGRSLASGSVDQTIRLWDIQSGQEVRILEGHISTVGSVHFSPDGQTLVSGSWDHTIRLWDVHTGQCLRSLQGHTHRIDAVSFSPDGQSIASGSWDHIIRLWDVHTGQCLRSLEGYSNWVGMVRFSPNGQFLASGGTDGTVYLWDMETGQYFRSMQGHKSWYWSGCFSPDGQLLASGSQDQTIRLWEVQSGRCFKILSGHTDSVASVHFSPDGESLVSGGEDQTIRLWDIRTGQCLKILAGHTHIVNSACFSPDGQSLASSSWDQTVRLWDRQTGQCFKTLEGHSSWIYWVCFSPDGQSLASGSGDQTIRLWDVHSGQCLKIFQGHTRAASVVCFSPDGQTLASASEDHTIRLWDVQSGQCLRILQGHTSPVWPIHFSPDGQTLASGSDDETIRLWEVKSGVCLKVLRPVRPYERLNISGATGLSEAQKATLKALGAFEDEVI